MPAPKDPKQITLLHTASGLLSKNCKSRHSSQHYEYSQKESMKCGGFCVTGERKVFETNQASTPQDHDGGSRTSSLWARAFHPPGGSNPESNPESCHKNINFSQGKRI